MGKFIVESTGLVKSSSANIPGHVSNMKLSYSAGQLKLVGYNGSDLSASNPGSVTVTRGTTTKVLTFTSSPLFDDDTAATSDIAGVYFHTTAAIAWNQDCPFFIYATYDTSDTPYIFISPCPNLSSISSSSARISYHNTVGGTQDKYSVFVWSSSVTPANLVSQPCVRIGSIAMTKVITTDDWTVTGSNGDHYGIGGDATKRTYTFPTGQFGAVSGQFVLNNGGTAPGFSTLLYRYKVHTDGLVTAQCFLEVSNGTDGSGSNTFTITIPYSFDGNGETPNYSNTARVGFTSTDYMCQIVPSHGANTAFFAATVPLGTLVAIQNNNFIAGSRRVFFEAQYIAF